MGGILNFVIGIITTFITVLVVIFVFNKWTTGGVASLGRDPITTTVSGAK